MGEDLQGKWLDKRSGKTIIVDDMIMDGDDMLIKTSIGIIRGDIFTNNYTIILCLSQQITIYLVNKEKILI